MPPSAYDTWPVLRDFASTRFTDNQAEEEQDFVAYLRWSDYELDAVTTRMLESAYRRWLTTASKGNWEEKCRKKLNRERRLKFGPGRFWASSPSGIFLNKNFVKGWGGVNPARPAGEVSVR